MRKFTIQEWARFPLADKGIWARLALEEGRVAPEFFGRRYLLNQTDAGNTFLIEGVDFIIEPTYDDLRFVAEGLLHSLDKELVCGIDPIFGTNPLNLTGKYVIDNGSMLYINRSPYGRSLTVEICFFETHGARFRNQTYEVKELRRSVVTKQACSVETVMMAVGELWNKRNYKILSPATAI